jgi:hypothetical protein
MLPELQKIAANLPHDLKEPVLYVPPLQNLMSGGQKRRQTVKAGKAYPGQAGWGWKRAMQPNRRAYFAL